MVRTGGFGEPPRALEARLLPSWRGFSTLRGFSTWRVQEIAKGNRIIQSLHQSSKESKALGNGQGWWRGLVVVKKDQAILSTRLRWRQSSGVGVDGCCRLRGGAFQAV